MLSKDEVNDRLDHLWMAPSEGLVRSYEAALETAQRLWQALEDECLGHQGPGIMHEGHNESLNAWCVRRHEHWSWFEQREE